MSQGSSDRERILADAALMDAIASGDDRAFVRLMREESPRLLRLGNSLLGNPAEAEDVLQDAFLKLWQAAAAWQPRARIATWLYRVVYTGCVDRLRQRRPTEDVALVEEILVAQEPSPEERLHERERERRMAWALGQLPPRQRSAVLLAHDQDLSQAEAAAVLEISEDAYESLLARGRRRLKELVFRAEGTADHGAGGDDGS